VLSLLLIVAALHSCAAQKKHKAKHKRVEHTMTVAAIRPANHEDAYITVTFLESARFYRLPKDANPAYLDLLKQSEKNHKPVLIKRREETSDIILSVKKKEE